MRIPLSKPYRAFPELDRFRDRECEEWVKRAWEAHRASLVTFNLLGGVVGLGFLPLAGLAAVGCWRVGELHGGDAPELVLLAFVGAVAVASLPVLLGLVIRDRALQRAIRRQLEGARCVRCRYSLLGLPIADGWVTCSECGERLSLEALGLSPEDLLARSSRD